MTTAIEILRAAGYKAHVSLGRYIEVRGNQGRLEVIGNSEREARAWIAKQEARAAANTFLDSLDK